MAGLGSFRLHLALLCSLLSIFITNSTITINNNGYYIGVYDDTNTYDWFEAKEYCMVNYGSSLASVHSSTDDSNLQSARPNTGITSWVGMSDIKTEGTYEWSDGSSNDYTLNWNSGEPNNYNGVEDCVEIYSSNLYNDNSCTQQVYQFICGITQNWRPIFKINNNVNDYGDSSSNPSDYYQTGTSTYDNYNDDVTYVLSSFDASTIDSTNYRSLAIDDWNTFYTVSAFDQIKISLYSGGTQVKFFVYSATSDSTSWMTQSNLIDSSYLNAQWDTSNIWSIEGDGGGKRFWESFHSYGGCGADYGWLVVTQGTDCTAWDPSEGNTSPQIRYSINTTANGLYLDGAMSDSTQNNVADTMVVYVNADDSSTFAIDYTNTYNSYTSVYYPLYGVSWYEAKDYCMLNYGSSLASVHSSTDESDLTSSFIQATDSWVGLNDINGESVQYDQTTSGGWEWSDGSDYDYAVSWNSGEPNDASTGEDCAEYNSAYNVNDYQCELTRQQFVCGESITWRAMFKINDNIADYGTGSQTNVYDYFINGDATYSSVTSDISYIENTFDASSIDSSNYRSILIDHWTSLYNYGKFDKIKVSLYKDGSEVRYFVFDATSDSEESASEPTNDATNDTSNDPSEELSEMASNMPSDAPTNATLCPTKIPSLSPSYVPSDEPTRAPSFEPSKEPSSMPSESPSDEPSNNPSSTPSDMPTNDPSNNPSSDPSMSPSNMASSDPSRSPSNNASEEASMIPSKDPCSRRTIDICKCKLHQQCNIITK